MRTTKVLTTDKVFNETWIEVRNETPFILINPDLGSHFRVVLTKNSTLGIADGTSGRRILLRIEQDSVGSRSLAVDGSVSDNITVDTTAGGVTILEFLFEERTSVWEPMPPVLTKAAADLLYDPLGAGTAAVATHVALPDPHTQYALKTSLGTMAAQNQITAQGDSVAADFAALKTDFNLLLAKLRTSGAMAT